MSFDLALVKGDLAIGADKDLRKVRDNTKLVQDVLKLLHMPLGSDPFFPAKGSTLTEANIGEFVNKQFIEARTEAAILENLQLIQTLQTSQALVQTVTDGERIETVEEVVVEQDSQDPRQFNIRITVKTGALTTLVLPQFSISTRIE